MLGMETELGEIRFLCSKRTEQTEQTHVKIEDYDLMRGALIAL